jgi:hypothetical protein
MPNLGRIVIILRQKKELGNENLHRFQQLTATLVGRIFRSIIRANHSL